MCAGHFLDESVGAKHPQQSGFLSRVSLLFDFCAATAKGDCSQIAVAETVEEELAGVVDGRLHAQHRTLLVVHLDQILFESMFDSQSFGNIEGSDSFGTVRPRQCDDLSCSR